MPNRLIHEKSPYLRQHAHNPVDWYPWGDEAIAKARTEDKPIFLSIGYSTCHWCHVMERESFEDPRVAEVLNRHFVPVKVDREERPDLDHIYMTAVQATTGQGGWPMSVWLTPQLEPFYCGTYFPPEPRFGRPGFRQLLLRIHEVWQQHRDAVVRQAREITQLIQSNSDQRVDREPVLLSPEALAAGRRLFEQSFDPVYGGFGGAPKFPRPVVFEFMLRVGATAPVLFTLRQMGRGGIFDQLGGGFHRYSVDERWLVPHFEKMLYDQALLLTSYCDAWLITHDPFFSDIARRTCDYVVRDLTDPAGGFYAAEDADSEGMEGRFYVWKKSEIPDEEICDYYGVTEAGNWEDGWNILHVTRDDPPPQLEAWRQRLFEIRSRRPRPHRDEKIIAAWNGLMISALCQYARTVAVAHQPGVPADARVLAFAQQAAARYLHGTLTRTENMPAVLDDYAAVATAMLDLYETDLDHRWLRRAVELANRMIEQFADSQTGSFFMTDGRDAYLIVRPRELYDGAEPSGQSTAILLLLRLADVTGIERYRQHAEQALRAQAAWLTRAPHAVPRLLCALDWHLNGSIQVALAGAPERFLSILRETYRPRLAVARAEHQTQSRPMLNHQPTAYVCHRFTCLPPVFDASALRSQLNQLSPPAS